MELRIVKCPPLVKQAEVQSASQLRSKHTSKKNGAHVQVQEAQQAPAPLVWGCVMGNALEIPPAVPIVLAV
jgi:hypothetical protein